MNRHIDLFSGIGGFALAAHWAGYKTEVFCEQDKYCQKVLRKHWSTVPIISDIRDFDGTQYQDADLLTGGFPCQPFSCAGKQRGHEDDRFLWPEMLRVISEAKPRWVVGENVTGIINLALDTVLSDLEAEGYETQAFIIPACAVNAPHQRNRIWIVAHAACSRIRTESSSSRERTSTLCCCETVADSTKHGLSNRRESPLEGRDSFSELKRCDCSIGSIRQIESRLGRVADGLPGRLDGHFDSEPAIPRVTIGVKHRASRLKALGNAIVPQVAYQIIQSINSLY